MALPILYQTQKIHTTCQHEALLGKGMIISQLDANTIVQKHISVIAGVMQAENVIFPTHLAITEQSRRGRAKL